LELWNSDMKPILIHISGLPCSGKSQLRLCLNEFCDFDTLDIQQVWHEVFTEPKYSKEEGEVVFAAFERRIESVLSDGRSIIAESVLASEHRHHRLAALGKRFNARCLFILLEADFNVLKSRLKTRNSAGVKTISEAAFDDLKAKFSTRIHADLILDSTMQIGHEELATLTNWINGKTIHP